MTRGNADGEKLVGRIGGSRAARPADRAHPAAVSNAGAASADSGRSACGARGGDRPAQAARGTGQEAASAGSASGRDPAQRDPPLRLSGLKGHLSHNGCNVANQETN
jgi:hypothetical protein